MTVQAQSISIREPLVSLKDCAAHLKFSPEYIRRLAKADKLPCLKVENGARTAFRFRLSEVERAMEKGISAGPSTKKAAQ